MTKNWTVSLRVATICVALLLSLAACDWFTPSGGQEPPVANEFPTPPPTIPEGIPPVPMITGSVANCLPASPAAELTFEVQIKDPSDTDCSGVNIVAIDGDPLEVAADGSFVRPASEASPEYNDWSYEFCVEVTSTESGNAEIIGSYGISIIEFASDADKGPTQALGDICD